MILRSIIQYYYETYYWYSNLKKCILYLLYNCTSILIIFVCSVKPLALVKYRRFERISRSILYHAFLKWRYHRVFSHLAFMSTASQSFRPKVFETDLDKMTQVIDRSFQQFIERISSGLVPRVGQYVRHEVSKLLKTWRAFSMKKTIKTTLRFQNLSVTCWTN